MDCVHCGAGIDVKDELYDGEEYVCEDCGLKNIVSIDDADDDAIEAYFLDCYDENCPVCSRKDE